MAVPSQRLRTNAHILLGEIDGQSLDRLGIRPVEGGKRACAFDPRRRQAPPTRQALAAARRCCPMVVVAGCDGSFLRRARRPLPACFLTSPHSFSQPTTTRNAQTNRRGRARPTTGFLRFPGCAGPVAPASRAPRGRVAAAKRAQNGPTAGPNGPPALRGWSNAQARLRLRQLQHAPSCATVRA